MKDYADRVYVQGRIHALMDGFPRRPEYAAMYNSSNITSAFSGIIGLSEEKDASRIKQHLFREKIYTLCELIDASSYYRQFLISILRLAEGQNLLLLVAHIDGMDVGDEWLDISPYHVLPEDINKKDITREEIFPVLQGTYLETVFSPQEENPVALIPDRFISAFINNCAQASRRLQACDRQGIYSHLALIMTLVRMSGLSRHHEFYSAEPEALGNKLIPEIRNFSCSASGAIQSRIIKSLKRYSTGDFFYKDSPYLRFLHQESMRIYRREWDSSSTVIAYMVCLFLLIRNLFIIAEGFRFGLAPQDIAGMIVCEE